MSEKDICLRFGTSTHARKLSVREMSVGSFSNDDGDGNENVKKAIGLWSRTTSLHIRVVTKISSCRVFVVSSRGSRKQSWRPPPPLQKVFAAQLLPFSKTHYRPKKAIFIKSTAIISGFMMITSLLKKTTSF